MALVLTGNSGNVTAPLTATVTALANNGSGEIRATTSAPHLFGDGDPVRLVTGVVTGDFKIKVIDSVTFDCVASGFTATSTGTAKDLALTPQIQVPTDGQSASLQLSGMLSAFRGIMDRTQALMAWVVALCQGQNTGGAGYSEQTYGYNGTGKGGTQTSDPGETGVIGTGGGENDIGVRGYGSGSGAGVVGIGGAGGVDAPGARFIGGSGANGGSGVEGTGTGNWPGAKFSGGTGQAGVVGNAGDGASGVVGNSNGNGAGVTGTGDATSPGVVGNAPGQGVVGSATANGGTGVTGLGNGATAAALLLGTGVGGVGCAAENGAGVQGVGGGDGPGVMGAPATAGGVAVQAHSGPLNLDTSMAAYAPGSGNLWPDLFPKAMGSIQIAAGGASFSWIYRANIAVLTLPTGSGTDVIVDLIQAMGSPNYMVMCPGFLVNTNLPSVDWYQILPQIVNNGRFKLTQSAAEWASGGLLNFVVYGLN